MSTSVAPPAQVHILDPSDKYRPEHKKEEHFRNFNENCSFIERVKKTYKHMHTEQTLETVRRKREYWGKLNHAEMTVLEAVEALDALVDESDPDVDVPNSVHAFQTAERIRECHPDLDWLHLTGLIHDLGKVMALYGEPQWFTVGDTFPLGCQFQENIVFGRESFKDNPDFNHEVYSTKLGIYEENCGLDKVIMSWGHDEYMYQVLKGNECHLPDEALFIIRFHSFYPWHTGKEYEYLTDNRDEEMKNWVLEFNKYDLYSKGGATPDPVALTPYYQSLCDKYLPGKIKW